MSTLTSSQQRLLQWLRLAGDYSRRVWGGELRSARKLAGRGLAIVWCDDGDWFATITRAGRAA